MLDKIKKYIQENVSEEGFANYLLRPVNEGKHYHIGGISELMDYTSEITCEDIEDLIYEKLIDITDSAFTLEYYLDMDEKGSNKKDITDSMILMVQKISPNNLFIMEFVCGEEAVINPIIAVIPLIQHNFNLSAEDFPEQFLSYLGKDGVQEEFLDTLGASPVMTSIGDICYYTLSDTDEEESDTDEAVNDLRYSAVNMLFRFVMLKKQGKEVKVTPNTKLETKGYLKLRDTSKDYYVVKLPDEKEYLGFSRKEPV